MARNTRPTRAPSRLGFTLIELLVVIAIIALLIGILLPALGEARRAGRLAVAQSNMKQVGVATNTYAADFADAMYGFSWSENNQPSEYSNLTGATTDNGAAANQAVDIFRRLGGREDIQPITGWIPHVLYSHLVLIDYVGEQLPADIFISPADRVRQAWAEDPATFGNGSFVEAGFGDNGNADARWAYSSSYVTPTAHYDLLQSSQVRSNGAFVQSRIRQSANTDRFQVPASAKLGGVKLTTVAFPSQKVALFDEFQRFRGEEQFWAYEDSVVPVTFYDASVRMITTSDVNFGWDPHAPTSRARPNNGPFVLEYVPKSWDPPAPDGRLIRGGYYQWTRGGLQGVDVGGNEIFTGQRLP